MKIKLVFISLFSFPVFFPVQAAQDIAAYYQITELVNKVSSSSQATPFGPYVSAVSADGSQIALMTRSFNIDLTWDTNLAYTNDYGCYYAFDVCHYQRYGSSQYPYGWSQWRDALRLASASAYEASELSYLLADGETGSIPGLTPDVVYSDPSGNNSSNSSISAFSQDGLQLVGSASAPFILSEGEYKREFTRRAFARTTGNSLSCSLLPTAFGSDLSADRGGFSAAYGINNQVSVTAINSGAVSTLVVGTASVGLPDDHNWDSFDACQIGNDYEYYRCPGFDTQAWAWDLSLCITGNETLSGMPLAQNWLNDDGGRPAYTSTAMAMNNSGIAVGMSTYALSNNSGSGRARAAYFEPDANGIYQMTPVPDLSAGFSDFNETVKHTWAVDINDNNLIVGNLRFNEEKGRNRPVEFFIYDKNAQIVTWPLRDEPQNGSNSQIFAINNNNLAIGWQDALGQDGPTINGTTRRQDGFVYDHNQAKSWHLTNLTCSIQNGEAHHPLYKIVYPKALTENNEIIATAYKYSSAVDYLNNTNPTSILVKLTPNNAQTMSEAPLCTNLFEDLELPKYERKGAGLWYLFPILLFGLCLKKIRFKSQN